jgi:hypothetical protein
VGRRSNVEVQVAGWQNVERLPKMLTFWPHPYRG